MTVVTIDGGMLKVRNRDVVPSKVYYIRLNRR